MLLLPSILLLCVPIIEEMAAAKAAVKFGSEAMAAVTVSTIEACRCPNCNDGIAAAGSLGGAYIGWPSSCGQPCKGRGNVVGGGGRRKGVEFGLCVKSRVMVGNGADADRVAIVDA